MKLKLNLLRFSRKISLPIFFSAIFFGGNFFNQEIFANKEPKAANDEDLYLYRGMGASYLCIASKAGIEFPKAVGVATATYVQVLEGKHGGLIKELGEVKLERKKLFAGAEFQIVETAIRYCPDSIPEEVSKKVKNILKENKTSKKNNKRKK
tara:strand:+ start:113 stop:568 length:456 start_codon:yes stop_codon:yes gene_type:complete